MGLCIFSILSLALFIFLYYTKQSYWCNTLFNMLAGMWYSCYKERIDGFLAGKRNYYLAAVVVSILFLVLYYMSSWERVPLPFSILYPFLFGSCSIMFCLLIVAFTMKIQIRSNFCSFLVNMSFQFIFCSVSFLFRCSRSSPTDICFSVVLA